MLTRVLAGLLALLLSGCASVQNRPLAAESAGQMKGRALGQTRYEPPSFVAYSPGAAAFGMLGLGAMYAEGARLVKEHRLGDPAIAISEALSQRLAAAHAMQALPAGETSASDDVATLSSAHRTAHYLVDVKTINWLLLYFPVNWSKYKIMYAARVRIIETQSQKIVAEVMCTAPEQSDPAAAPTKEQLLEEDARLLKRMLDDLAGDCAERVMRGPAST